MGWQRAANRLRAGEGTHGRLIGRRVGGHFILGRGGLEFLELHLQLIEQLAAAFGRGAETIALHFGDQQLQMRDHRLGAGGAGFRFATRLLFGGEGGAKCFGVGGNRIGHRNDSTTIASRWVQEIRLLSMTNSARRFRPPCAKWISPIYPLQHVAELSGGDGDHAIRRRGPNEPAALQSFVTQLGMQALRLPRSSLLL